MPIQGFVRMRRHLFGRQSAVGTPCTADRAYPFSGTPTVNLNWTDPNVDVGSIDLVAAPYRVAPTPTASLTDPALAYNNIPLLMSGIFGGGVEPSGAGVPKTWAFAPASDASDAIDAYTYQFGDDVTTDWFELSDGVLSSLEFTGPDGLGPVTTSMSWQFGAARSTGSTDSPALGSVPGAATVSTNDAIVYLKDAGIYIADSVAGLAAGQITDALHSFSLRITQAWDPKRFANASQVFDVTDYGRGERGIELECTWAKTTDTVGTGSESDDWFSDEAVTRYVRITFTSTVKTSGSTPYSWTFTMPMRYYTRTEGAIGGNTTVVLTGRAFDEEGTFGGVFTSTAVNTLHGADLNGGDVS